MNKYFVLKNFKRFSVYLTDFKPYSYSEHDIKVTKLF